MTAMTLVLAPVGMTRGFVERRPQSVQQGRLVRLYGEKEVPIALADHCGHSWCRSGGIQGHQPSRKSEGGGQSLNGRRLDAAIRPAGYAPLRLDLAQDVAFAASCVPLGTSLTRRSDA